MAGAIDRATLDRLVALGRERGELSANDLQAALPVEAMDIETLALVMLELEEAGISVEPEAFGPQAESDAAPRLTLPLPEPDIPPPSGPPAAGRRPIAEGRDSAGRGRAPDVAAADEGVGRVVLLAGLAVVLVLGTILVLI